MAIDAGGTARPAGDKRAPPGFDVAPHVRLLGIDGDGARHYYSIRAGVVWVLPAGCDRETATTADADRFDLAATPVGDVFGWVAHVRGKRGWRVVDPPPEGIGYLNARAAAAIEDGDLESDRE